MQFRGPAGHVWYGAGSSGALQVMFGVVHAVQGALEVMFGMLQAVQGALEVIFGTVQALHCRALCKGPVPSIGALPEVTVLVIPAVVGFPS